MYIVKRLLNIVKEMIDSQERLPTKQYNVPSLEPPEFQVHWARCSSASQSVIHIPPEEDQAIQQWLGLDDDISLTDFF